MGKAEVIQMKIEVMDTAISACGQQLNTFDANKNKLLQIVAEVTQDDFVGKYADSFLKNFETTKKNIDNFVDYLERLKAALTFAKEKMIEAEQAAADVFNK